MKKKLYLFAAATMALASCSQEEGIVEGNNGGLKTMEITAGMPEGDSRTSFTDGGIKWQDGDALSVFVGGSANHKFTISPADGEQEMGPGYNTAKFTCVNVNEGNTYANNVAYYPYAEGVTLTQSEETYTLNATFPTVQPYAAEGSFGANSLPMVAVTETTATPVTFDFKSLGGWMQLYVKGDATITKVVMKADGHKIAGDYTVTASYGETPSIEMKESAVDQIVVECAEGVQLSANKATLFTFAVPPFTFNADEVSFDIYDNGGGIMENAYTITKAGTIVTNAYYTLSKSKAVVYQPNKMAEGYVANGAKLNEEGEYEISNANGLRWVAETVNATEPYTSTLFDGTTVKLMCDIDLKNTEWIPIGDDRSQRTEFHGVFDGQGHTISNFKITKKTEREDENKSSYGLFGNLKGTVKNLTVSNVYISGAPKFIGALVGRMNDGLIENCHVVNSFVECNNWTIGGLLGQWNNGKISGCTVEGTSVTGYAAAGAMVGIALNSGERTIENCSVSECTIGQNGEFGGNYDKMFGTILGATYGSGLIINMNNCKAINTKVRGEISNDLFGFLDQDDIINLDGTNIAVICDGLWKLNDKEFHVRNANGLVALTSQEIKGGESISLGADIDLTGVEFNGLNVQNWAGRNNIDGKGYTISNWNYEGGASDMGFVRNWIGTVENINFKNCNLKTGGRSAIVAAKIYGNINNIHVEDCSITDSYWACGIIAGLYNAGSIDGCIVKNSSVKSNGGTAAIVGVINEEGGTRKVSNCRVEGTKVHNTGIYGDSYSGAIIVGMFNGLTSNNPKYVLENCTFANNTIEGGSIENALYFSKATEGIYLIVDGKIVEHPTGYSEEENGDVTIYTAKGMQWFANQVNVENNAFNGKTVQLAADIDLKDIDWEPIGQTGKTTFNGIFDGQNFTISNLKVDSDDQTGAHYSSGLFGWVETHTEGRGHLKNVRIAGANIKGHHNCGALVGYITEKYALVENCHVTNAEISCTYANGDADGDKAGALIGNATVATTVNDCTASNSTVSAGRDSGQLIGAGKQDNVTDCSVTNVTVTANGTGSGKNIRNEVIGRLL